jgi:hypothetical protein
MAKKKKPTTMMDTIAPIRLVRDVADFHLRWQEFRPTVLSLAEKHDLTAEQRDILRWLIKLADRVGSRDVT